MFPPAKPGYYYNNNKNSIKNLARNPPALAGGVITYILYMYISKYKY